MRENGIEPHSPTGPMMAHRGRKKNVAKSHDVNTRREGSGQKVTETKQNVLMVIRNCPICWNEHSAESVMENPAANVVNAAMNTAEPTRVIDPLTRVSRSSWCLLYNRRRLSTSIETNEVRRGHIQTTMRFTRRMGRVSFAMRLGRERQG